jgi:hypothetical protein
MFLNILKYRHFIGQSEHVFKKMYFSLSRRQSRRPENLGLRIWLKTPIFCVGTFEKKPYLLPTTIRRTPGTNKFIFQMVPTIRVQLYAAPRVLQLFCENNTEILLEKNNGNLFNEDFTVKLILKSSLSHD